LNVCRSRHFFLNMNLISEQSWYYILLCFSAGFVYAFLLYRNEKARQSFSKLLLYSLFAFRFISVLIISLLLMGFFLKRIINQTEKPLIIIAIDNSSSIVAGKDSFEIKNNFLKSMEALRSSLSGKYSIQSLLFGGRVEAGDKNSFTDKETDLSQLFREVDNNYSNRNIGALVVASDGIINKGSSPLAFTDKFKFPVYTIALGDTTLKKDLFIQKINHNQVVYLGNKFPVEVNIQSLKLKGKPSTVSVFLEGVKKAEQLVTITGDNFTQTLNFVLEADKPGVQKYTVQATPVTGEINLINNSQSFVVEVIDNREKILILAQAPHPDVAALKESIESNPSYEVELSLASEFTKPLKPYSLVIFHTMLLNSNRFLGELTTNGQSLLLVHPQLGDNLPGVKMTTSYNKLNETEAIFNKNFTLFNVSDELKNFVKDLPAVNSFFANYSVSVGANSLLFQKIGIVDTENPLLVFNNNSGQKTALFFGDGLWKWKLRDYAMHNNHNLFNELIGKTIQYLSVKADKSFFRLFTKKIINENEAVEFKAEVYNKSYQLITDPEVTVRLVDEAGKQYNYTLSKNNTSYFIEAGLFPPSEYSYKANVKTDGEIYTQSGTITIKAIVAEKVNTVADHTLLFQLAKNTGGKLFYPNQVNQLEQTLLTNELIKPITYTQKQLNDLIDLKWIFFLILGLLSIEWFLRKRNGSI
jgi:transcriptional regulator CtsR